MRGDLSKGCQAGTLPVATAGSLSSPRLRRHYTLAATLMIAGQLRTRRTVGPHLRLRIPAGKEIPSSFLGVATPVLAGYAELGITGLMPSAGLCRGKTKISASDQQ
jgi:hypothetical protein